MNEELDLILMEAEEGMEKAIHQYQINLAKISAGRANPQILEFVKVDYYGSVTPLSQMANITVPEPRQLLIKPFDLSAVKDVVTAINSASLGLNAVNEGDKVRISFPDLTTERRRELVKSLGNYTEQARVAIRGCRQDANKGIKALEGMSEDTQKFAEADVQKLTDKFNAKIADLTEAKEKELMTI